MRLSGSAGSAASCSFLTAKPQLTASCKLVQSDGAFGELQRSGPAVVRGCGWARCRVPPVCRRHVGTFPACPAVQCALRDTNSSSLLLLLPIQQQCSCRPHIACCHVFVLASCASTRLFSPGSTPRFLVVPDAIDPAAGPQDGAALRVRVVSEHGHIHPA